jgi:ankyrin repeat protein
MQQDHMGRTPLHHFFNRTTQRILEYHQDDIDSTADDFRGMTIAHYVAWSKSATVADFDRCSGGQSSIEKIDQDGRSAIHLALYRGNLALVDYFLKLPNRPEFLPDWHGRTVLHYAVESKRTNTIDMLHSNGFDLHVRDLDGRTPLHYAASKGKLEAVKRLLDLGATADLTALDLHGMTPLQLARVHKADAVTQHLQLLYPTGTANQEHPKNSPVNFPSTATKRGHHGLYYPFTLLLFISILIGFINIQPQYFKAWCI